MGYGKFKAFGFVLGWGFHRLTNYCHFYLFLFAAFKNYTLIEDVTIFTT